jgi:2-iminobutanoate/2-iminopropanoate deaminase
MRCFELLFRIAEAAGFSRDEFVLIDIAFADLADIGAVNGVFESQFPANRRPARAVHQAARLAFGARIRVQGTASR